MVMVWGYFAVCYKLNFLSPIFSQFAGLSDISISQDIPVEGEITIPMRARARELDNSTLNESVRHTIVSYISQETPLVLRV